MHSEAVTHSFALLISAIVAIFVVYHVTHVFTGNRSVRSFGRSSVSGPVTVGGGSIGNAPGGSPSIPVGGANVAPGSGPVNSPPPAGVISSAPSGHLSVTGISVTKTIACDGGFASVEGISNVVTITGHCVSLTVSASANQITVDTADTITSSGVSNQIIFHSGSPVIDDSGISDVVQQG